MGSCSFVSISQPSHCAGFSDVCSQWVGSRYRSVVSSCPPSSHVSTTHHKLTCSALLLICSVLTVPLSVASPRQRNTFAGSPSAIKLLWRTGLSACREGVEVNNSEGESAERGDREGRGKWTADEKVGGREG